MEPILPKWSYVRGFRAALIAFALGGLHQIALTFGTHHMVVTVTNHFLSFLKFKGGGFAKW